jgi:hypothetical protein
LDIERNQSPRGAPVSGAEDGAHRITEVAAEEGAHRIAGVATKEGTHRISEVATKIGAHRIAENAFVHETILSMRTPSV